MNVTYLINDNFEVYNFLYDIKGAVLEYNINILSIYKCRYNPNYILTDKLNKVFDFIKIIKYIRNLDSNILVITDKKLVKYAKYFKGFVVTYYNQKESNVVSYKYLSENNTYIPLGLLKYPKNCSNLNKKSVLILEKDDKKIIEMLDILVEVKKVFKDLKIFLKDDINGYIKNYIIGLKLDNNIVLFSNVDDIYSNVSVYISGGNDFGYNYLKVASYGIPTVTYKNNITSELIKNNWDGYLVENTETFIKKTCDLLFNKNRLLIMGDNALKKAYEYNMITSKKKWVKLFNKLK